MFGIAENRIRLFLSLPNRIGMQICDPNSLFKAMSKSILNLRHYSDHG